MAKDQQRTATSYSSARPLQSRLRYFRTAHQLSNFMNPFIPGQVSDGGRGAFLIFELLHHKMLIRKPGNFAASASRSFLQATVLYLLNHLISNHDDNFAVPANDNG